MLKLYSSKQYKMQNSSPDTDPVGSTLLYNDSGYITNINTDRQSFSSNSNSENSFEVIEDSSLQIKQSENLLHSTNGMYFCENAVFDEPKLEGPPLLWDNTNNYEQFSSLIKFSLEETSESYLSNTNLYSNVRDSSNSEYCESVAKNCENVLQYFDQNSLSSFSSINTSQSLCATEINKQNIVSQAVEECLTVKNMQCNNDKTDYKNPAELSPELFSEEEDEPCIKEISVPQNILVPSNISQSSNFVKNDRLLLKRLQETLKGFPPPPSVTILQLSASEMLDKIHKNKELFLNKDNQIDNSNKSLTDEKKVKTLLISSSADEVEKNSQWPNIIKCRYHGLYYNRGKESEDFEHYCTKYATLYVGVETASSCTVWSMTGPGSASKRRNIRRGLKSPGRRLSHLAKRRITFSSSNLQQVGSSFSVIGNTSVFKQLMVDFRKTSHHKRKSPWKKSPRKSPQKRIRTPNKSAQKRSARQLNQEFDEEPKPGCSKMSSTKRALFQSPDHSRSTISSSDTTTQLLQRKSKRALFMSPNKKSPMKNPNADRKRKRVEEDCQPNKFPRSLSFDVQHSKALNATVTSNSMQRRNSEVIVRKGTLSELHKQKMLWAVSEALRSQNINMSHPQFRQYASLLCKVVKHLVPDLLSNGPRQPGSTSDRMLRIARQHCYAVTRGKTFEEIMKQVKETNDILKNLKPPSGYVGLETTTKNVLQDKVMNVESNKKKSPLATRNENTLGENSKLASIKRQIIFDDTEIAKTCNTNR